MGIHDIALSRKKQWQQWATNNALEREGRRVGGNERGGSGGWEWGVGVGVRGGEGGRMDEEGVEGGSGGWEWG